MGYYWSYVGRQSAAERKGYGQGCTGWGRKGMLGVFGKMSPGGGGGTIESSAACLSVGNPRYWRSLRRCSFRAVCIVGRGNVFSLLYNIPTARVCLFYFLLNTG